MKFKCCFLSEVDDDYWKEYNDVTGFVGLDDVAEEYADYCFSERDMWEHGNDYWDNDYTIVVMDEEGKKYYFEIEVSHSPCFRAIKKESDENE